MSLVIAKIIDGRIIMESDSQLSTSNSFKQNPISTVLKVIIISPRVVVSFAGDVKSAHEALGEVFSMLRKNPETSPEDISSALLKVHLVHVHDGGSVDFILAISDMNNPKLYKTSMGETNLEANSAWIGDYDGFELFQNLYNTSPSDELDYPAKCRKFTKAFNGVISAREIPSVAGFNISVSSSGETGLFKYLISGEIGVPVQTIPAGTESRVAFGDAAMGGYSASIIASNADDTPAMAIYFEQLKFGLLFIPSYSLDAIRINELSGLDFIQEVCQEYGIELTGMLVDTENNQVANIGNSKIRIDYNITSDAPVNARIMIQNT
jgi:hypothetical protein